MPVTFQVVGNLADFGDDVRAGVKVRATATPGVKVGDVAVHSNQPETVVTDETGAFTLELVSLPGVWYRIQTPYANAINTVNLAGYVPDVDDPTTGEAFPADTVIDLIDVVDEDPTPGYDVLAYTLDSGGGVTVHSGLTGRSAADQHPTSAITGLDAALAAPATALAAHAADTTGVHGIADTSALVLTNDTRLADARAPLPHTSASVTDFTEAAQDAIAALLAGASGVSLSYDDTANTLTITGPGTAGLDAEAVRDAIGVALVGSGLITVTVNDALDTITVSTTATANATDAALRDRSTHTGTQALGTITGTGDAAAKNTGTTAGTVAAGDHDHDDRYVVVVEHGAVGSTARPSGATVVLWVGSATPANSIAGDQWDDASGVPAVYIEEGDLRLTDARTPTAHVHGVADIGTGTPAAGKYVDGGTGAWTTLPGVGGGGSVATDTIWDAKGDLAVGTGSDTASRLAATTNGHVLTLDSGEATGMKWAAAAADPWTYIVSTVATSTTSTTPISCTGLALSGLANGLYEVQFVLRTNNATNTTEGPQPGVEWASATGVRVEAQTKGRLSGSFTVSEINQGNGTSVLLNRTEHAGNTNFAALVVFDALVRATSMTGAINATIRAETGAATVSVEADSFIKYRKVAN